MTEFTIQDEDLVGLKEKVVIITGCSSGIGLATAELLLETGAFVVGGDLNPSLTNHTNFTFLRTSVTQWADLTALFKQAFKVHNRIDHVFPNAGISGGHDYLEETFDESGELQEPTSRVFDVNLRAVANTTYLALHHLRRNPQGGSIVLIGSASSFQRFQATDYAAAKHGVLGLMRGLVPNIRTAGLPVRINTVAPSWTESGMVPKELIEAAGKKVQEPQVVARKVALLMADGSRDGQLIYSWEGRYKEVEEAVLLPAADEILGRQERDDVVLGRVYEAMKKAGT